MSRTAGYIPDVEERAAEVLVSALRRPRVLALVTASARRVQEIEDVMLDLRAQLDIASASGGWLDRLGRLVGERRGDLGDALYRRFVQARLLVNSSTGHIERIARIGALIADGRAEYIPIYPAGFGLLLLSDLPLDAGVWTRALARLRAAAAAGVWVEVYDGTGLDPDVEIFKHDSSEHDSSALQVRVFQ